MAKAVKQTPLPEGMESTIIYPGGFTMADFYRKIIAMESAYDKVAPANNKFRLAFENQQTPDSVPTDKKYIVENLSTDLVRGLEGQLIGGRIKPMITGIGDMETPLIELYEDIVFRANKFNVRKLEPIANYFYVEGKCSIGVDHNPYKKGPYGIGVPEITVYKPHEGLWDNNVSSMHEGDKFRCVRSWTPVGDVENEFGLKDLPTQGDTYENIDTQEDVVRYGNLYSLEYWVKTFDPVDGAVPEEDGRVPRIENKTYYICKIWDRTKMVQPPEKTGFSSFKLTPVIHTQRMAYSTEPFGVMELTDSKQDNLNVIKSVIYQAVKDEIKNLTILVGASHQEEVKVRREAKKTNGFVALRNERARVFEIKGSGIAVALIQWYEMERRGFDEVSGRYGPERGAVDGDLSGKAVIALQNRGTVPELVAKAHLEDSFAQMSMLILECIAKKMSGNPFAIERQVEGKKRMVYYNTALEDLPENFDWRDDPYSVVTRDGNIDMINDLRKVDIDTIDLDIEVVMNVIGWEQAEANKALLSFQNGLMARLETTKKLYPNDWKAIYEGKSTEGAVQQLIARLMELGAEFIPVFDKLITKMEKDQGMLDEAGDEGS